MDTTRWPEDTYKETIIGPKFAAKLLENVAVTSSQGVVPWVVDLYSDLLRTGKWQPQFLISEGHPVLTKGGVLHYGVQRCMACVRTGIPFETVFVELPSSHQGYF
jgi:hypothetical protein